MAKKAFFVIVLAVFLTFIYAGQNADDVPMEEIEQQLLENTELADMSKCGNRTLMQFYGLDYAQFDEYLYYKSSKALSVDELLIVKAKAASDLDGAKDAAESRIQSQLKTYEGYGPEQVAMLKNAIVIVRGNYLFCCVADAPERYKEVFTDAI